MAAATMVLAVTIPASATPSQANYSGYSVDSSSAAQAEQNAVNQAIANAAAAGFNSSQCLTLGIPTATPNNNDLYASAAARTASHASPRMLPWPPPTTTWDGSAQVQCTTQPAPGTVNLNRYYGPAHLSTVWSPPGGYHLEGTLGWLYTSPQPGTRPLYMCQPWGFPNGSMTSLQADCEGQQYFGVLGYIPINPPAGVPSKFLRRCRIGGDHFDSNDPNCEGQIQEGVLGYALS